MRLNSKTAVGYKLNITKKRPDSIDKIHYISVPVPNVASDSCSYRRLKVVEPAAVDQHLMCCALA